MPARHTSTSCFPCFRTRRSHASANDKGLGLVLETSFSTKHHEDYVDRFLRSWDKEFRIRTRGKNVEDEVKKTHHQGLHLHQDDTTPREHAATSTTATSTTSSSPLTLLPTPSSSACTTTSSNATTSLNYIKNININQQEEGPLSSCSQLGLLYSLSSPVVAHSHHPPLPSPIVPIVVPAQQPLSSPIVPFAASPGACSRMTEQDIHLQPIPEEHASELLEEDEDDQESCANL
ncbi:unnamed protein product [Amoebophrya sp. A25]|nr:unnamed protein product [Amoebophrya sp. A25]|eukprot:GSA25T00018330001.1